MANEQDRIILLKQIRALQKDIETLENSQTTSAQDRLDIESQIKKIKTEVVITSRKLLKANEEIRKVTKQYLESQVELESRITSISDQQFFIKDIEKKRIQHMNTIDTKLTSNLDKFNQMSDLNQEIANLSSDEISKASLLNIEYDEIASSVDRRGKGSKDQLAILAEQNNLAGRYASLTDTQRDVMEGHRKVLDGVKKTMMGVVETAEVLVSTTAGKFGSALIGAGFLMEKLGHTAHKTGTFFDEMTLSATGLGFIFDDATNVAMGLSKELGGIEHSTFKAQLQTNLLANNLDISGDEAASLVGSFSRLNGNSTEIASSTIQATKALAKANGVIPSQVMADMAGSTQAFAEYGKEGGKNIAEAAVYAAKLGVNMGALTNVTDSLLDFESSITKEMELGVMLGRSINLNKARQLAYDGEIGSAVKESLNQLGGIESFNKMDIYQKRAAADAIGLSVEELQRMGANMDKLNADGSMQLSNLENVGSKFDYISETMKGIVTGPGGGFLKMLGSGTIAMGQMGFPLKTMGKDMKSLAMNAKDALKSIGSKAWKLLGGGGGESIAGGAVQTVKETLTDKLKDTGSEKLEDVGDSMTDKLKDKFAGGGKDSGEKSLGKGSITDKLGKINMTAVLKGAAALVIVAGAVWVFGKAVQEFMQVSWNAVGMAVVSMAALIGGVLLLGTLMSGGMIVPLLAGAAAMVIVAGAIWILGKAIQEMATGFSALGMIGGTISTLIPMIAGIGLLSVAFAGLAGSLMLLGTAGIVALPGLMGLSMASKGLSVVADMFGFGSSSSETTGVEKGSISEYETKMLQKMDELIGAVKTNKDVYIDKTKITKVLSKSLEKNTENLIGLSVA